MASPRLFISSTYYDLRYVRSDLDVLREQLAVEIVRFEDGSIAYHTAGTLPEACCKEIEKCQIFISIIGGRYGSTVEAHTAQRTPDQQPRLISFSRLELEHAVSSGLLLFTFVDSGVLNEHRTYEKNRGKPIEWATVDDEAVFDFIDFIKALPGRNPVFEFRTPRELQEIVRIQLAGLFSDLLQREQMEHYRTQLQQLMDTAERFMSLEGNLRDEEKRIKNLEERYKMPDHEFFTAVREKLNANFPIYFTKKDELTSLLDHFGFDQQITLEEMPEWEREMLTYRRSDSGKSGEYFAVSRDLFDQQGNLRLPSHLSENAVWRGTDFRRARRR